MHLPFLDRNSWTNKRVLLKEPACFRLAYYYQRDFVNERFAPSSFGRASLTVRLRPSRFLPSRAAIAALPSEALLMVTNANPRDLPVMRSVTRCTSVTVPYCANRSFRSGSVVLKERFPTYSFIFLVIERMLATKPFPRTGFQITFEKIQPTIFRAMNK